MFDSISVICPKCHVLTQFQSKAGKCMLLTYGADHVPTAIAADIAGQKDHCNNCHTPLICMSNIPLYGRVWAEEDKEETDE